MYRISRISFFFSIENPSCRLVCGSLLFHAIYFRVKKLYFLPRLRSGPVMRRKACWRPTRTLYNIITDISRFIIFYIGKKSNIESDFFTKHKFPIGKNWISPFRKVIQYLRSLKSIWTFFNFITFISTWNTIRQLFLGKITNSNPTK